MDVQIEYCRPCGLLPAAEEAEHAILEELGGHIDALRFVPGHGGVFKVSVDDEVVFDNGHDPWDLSIVVDRVRQRLTGSTGQEGG